MAKQVKQNVKKLKAGSLAYATVFILIISVICFSFYSLFFYTNQSVSAYIDLHQTHLNARSAINLLLSRQDIIKSGEKKTISLFDSDKDTVEVEKNYWGSLEIVSATAIDKEYHYNITALVGNQSVSDTSFALFLADQNNPLVVAGKTEITGNCYLPQGTIKTGYINGQPFSGNKPVNGVIKKSPGATLSFNQELYKHLQSEFEKESFLNDSILNLQKQNLPDSLIQAFNKRTLTLYSSGIILLDRLYMKGRIKVVSEKKIIVKQGTYTEDITLYAPVIEFEKGYKGSLQAFASDTLRVGEKCEFKYPSVLGVVHAEKSASNPLLIIDKELTLTGDIFALDEIKDYTKHIVVSIGEQAKIRGRIYSADIVDFKGALHGSLACNRIIYANSSAVYENHLFNVEINTEKLPLWYVGSSVIKQKSKNGIIKWL